MAATNWQYNEKIPKISGVLRGNCLETCCNILQKVLIKKFTKKNSLTRQVLFQNDCSIFLSIKEIIDEVAVDSRFVLFEVIILIHL